MRLSCIFTVFLIANGLGAVEIPELPESSKPGMELGKWVAESFGNKGSAEFVESNHCQFLQLNYRSGDNQKTVFRHDTFLKLPQKAKLRMRIHAGQPVKLSIALSTTKDFVWNESKLFELKEGWNKVECQVSSMDWKSEASHWKNTSAVASPDEVRAVDLVVYNGDKSGDLYVVNMQYDLDEQGNEIKKHIDALRSDDPQKSLSASKALIELGRPSIEMLNQLKLGSSEKVSRRAEETLKTIFHESEKTEEKEMPGSATTEQREEREELLSKMVTPAEAHRLHMHKQIAELQSELQMLRSILDQAGIPDEKRELYIKSFEKIDRLLKPLQQPK